MQLEARIKYLESLRKCREMSRPLIDYRWTGPAPEDTDNISYQVDGETIARWTDESDQDYLDRCSKLCLALHDWSYPGPLPTMSAYIPELHGGA